MSESTALTVFDQLKADVTIFVAPCSDIVVTSQESSATALEVAKQVKTFMKKIESTRELLVAPHIAEQKRINAYAKQIVEPLTKAEGHLKKQLLAWEAELEKLRREEAKKLEAAKLKAEAEARAKLEAQQEEAATMAMFMDKKEVARNAIVAEAEMTREIVDINKNTATEMKTIEATKVSGVTRRWVFEVTDKSLVPAEFMIVDEVAVRKAMLAMVKEQNMKPIPGVRMFQEAGIAI